MKIIYLFTILVTGLILSSCEEPPPVVNNPYAQDLIPWPSLADSPWPIVRHDAQGTGRSQYPGAQTGELFGVIDDEFFTEASPVIGHDNAVYIVGTRLTGAFSVQTVLYRFTGSGEKTWDYIIDDAPESRAVPVLAAGNRLYVSSFEREAVLCLDSETGELMWESQVTDGASSQIGLDREGNLYLSTRDGLNMLSLDSEGGERWRFTPGDVITADWDPPIFSPDGFQVYYTGRDSIYVFSTSGEIIWTRAVGETVIHPILDNKGNLYFGDDENDQVTCLHQDGSVRWQISYSTIQITSLSSGVAPTIDEGGNLYFRAKSIDGVPGIVSLTNDGLFRWYVDKTSFASLICDTDGIVYLIDSISEWTFGAADIASNFIYSFTPSDYHGRIDYTPAIGSNGRIYWTNTPQTPALAITK